MDKSFKNKNTVVIVLEIFLIIIGIVGITFATSRLLGTTSKTTIVTGTYEVDYKGNLNVTGENLEPISDDKININTTDSVLRSEFSIRGSEKNNSENLIYDIILKDMSIDCNLLNEYTKWRLYKNGSLLSQGNFSPKFDSNVKGENLQLTEIQEDLPKATDSYDDYVLIIWISETCDNLETCEFIDQSNIIGKYLSATSFVAIYSGEKVPVTRISNNDMTCANTPILEEKMIPAYYENGVWKIADKKNGTKNSWYNYENKMWANAIITNDSSYLEMTPGTEIKKNDIIAQFVWIPRYKYQVWNVEETVTDSYDAYNKGINISFEPGTSTSGTITCNNEKCTGKNNDYLTHPAFENKRGFWISKYEISNKENPMFISNNKPILNEDIETYKELIINFNKEAKVSSNIINNLEWGAASYLSHSKYGICKNNKCETIESNNQVTSGLNKYDSTTRNIYGIYDMSGSAAEYVTGSNILGSATTEIILEDNSSWYNTYNVDNEEYLLRGTGSLFQSSTFGMTDYTTRIVIK